ncbi:MAG TPA: hypothetical protein VK357_07255 [Rubrobacteraceae bacterium]|nr:hypothetical protein [Rubrobacteraceae bacterium]
MFRISEGVAEVARQGRSFPVRPSFERATWDMDQTTERPAEGE